jgi:hypothetical protein
MTHDEETKNFLGDFDNDEREPYNDSDGEPDYTLEDDEEFEESLRKALRWPLP